MAGAAVTKEVGWVICPPEGWWILEKKKKKKKF